MLEKELKDKIIILDKVKDWKSAIEKAAKPLLEKGDIEKTYVDTIIKKIEERGNYIIIEPKVAMPHARPEDGVNKNCISLLKINEGVSFEGEEEKVYLIFMLGAKDSSSHIDILRDLMNVIDNEEKINKLILAKSLEEITNIIKER